VQQWRVEFFEGAYKNETWFIYLANKAARWGADQELDACCWWLNKEINTGWCLDPQLRTARRPKPPSLKEQALELVSRIEKAKSLWAMSELETIRLALEALPE
jgi:hypothetical protein